MLLSILGREAARVRRSPLKIALIGIFLFIISYHFLIPYEAKAYIFGYPDITACNIEEAEASLCNVVHSEARIPNVLHFVYILVDPTSDFPLQFSHFISIYAAWYRWRPDKIYLHVNVDADSEPIRRAKSGATGKWNQLVFNFPDIVINTVQVPTHTDAGIEIVRPEHLSDFVRVQVVHDFGGIYIDTDVHALRDVATLREMGFGAVTGRQTYGSVQSGTFMSEKGGELISRWRERMHRVYDGGWTTHSDRAITYVAEGLEDEGDGCEVLILGKNAFTPLGGRYSSYKKMFSEYDDGALPANVTQGDELPWHSDEITVNNSAEETPPWGMDWACTYLVHVISTRKPRDGANSNGISPRSVLERNSNFAVAVYPIVKHLYDTGMITLDDTDSGL
jgi:hypothetical protein